MDWSETDLVAMQEYLGEGISIPFPMGLTQNYVEASGTDQDGVYFIVYDEMCGDLTSEYGSILLQNGFEQETSDEENSSIIPKSFLGVVISYMCKRIITKVFSKFLLGLK